MPKILHTGLNSIEILDREVVTLLTSVSGQRVHLKI